MVIASATGIATASKGTRAKNYAGVPSRADETLKAMEQAVLDCEKQGITDPAKVKASILEARDRIKRGA